MHPETSNKTPMRAMGLSSNLLVFILLLVAAEAFPLSSSWGRFVPQRVAGGDHRYRPPTRPSAALTKGALRMGMDIKIRIVGRKNGCEKWLEDAYSMYEMRLRPSNIGTETIWHKGNEDLVKGVQTDAQKGHTVVLMDPLGKISTSEKFSEDMYDWLDEGGSRLSFVIGGAEGLPPEIRYGNFSQSGGSGSSKRGGDRNGCPYKMISLSAMTFTHQFARTILMEQIYRASEIRKGSGYHK